MDRHMGTGGFAFPSALDLCDFRLAHRTAGKAIVSGRRHEARQGVARIENTQALNPKTCSPPEVDRIWGIWGSYHNIPRAIFYLLKVDYNLCYLREGKLKS